MSRLPLRRPIRRSSTLAPLGSPQAVATSIAHENTSADPYHNYVNPSFGEIAWNGAREAVTIFKEIASLLPMAGQPLVQVLGAIKVSMDIVNEMHQNRDGYQHLMERILRLTKPLAEKIKNSQIDPKSDTAANLYMLEWCASWCMQA